MKNVLKAFGIIALVAVIGFSMAACDTGGPGGKIVDVNDINDGDDGITDGSGITTDDNGNVTVGSGRYAGKDVLGNSYSILVGSDVSRAAVKNDRIKMSVTGRNGKTRNVYGKVKSISADGTLTLETDKGEEFTAVVGGSNLGSIASDGAKITFDDNTTLIPRTFDKIYLRANRWSTNDPSNGPSHGENWTSGSTILINDFPTNVSSLVYDNNRYTVKISGTTDQKIGYLRFNIFGITENNSWVWLASHKDRKTIEGNFNITIPLDDVTEADFLNYKEVVMDIQNNLLDVFDNHPDWNTSNGTIPADIPDGQIMATISNFNFALKDEKRAAFKGNTNDYTYGFQEDGFSINYQLAVWSLTPENIVAAKGPNAKFEFIITDHDIEVFEDKFGPTLAFMWQSPDQGLWWQGGNLISAFDNDGDGEFKFFEGAEWVHWQNKVILDLSKFIKDSRFANSTQVNFIVGCWYNYYRDKDYESHNINDLAITGANIYNLPPCTGNMGNYKHAYEGDSITINFQSMSWDLPDEILKTAQKTGAKLEFVFSKGLGDIDLALVWEDEETERWWPDATEAGANNENLYIYKNGSGRSGVTYDSAAKKLTIILDQALETYKDTQATGSRKGFESATDASIILYCWRGADKGNITNLGFVSANIVQ